jgi:hypothetical protein
MRWLAACCAWLAGLVVIYLSNLAFFVAGGSDSLTDIAAPPRIGQVVALLLAGAGLGYAAWSRAPGGVTARTASVAGAVILLGLASHRVVIDNGRGEIRDFWLLTGVQTLPFDQRDGPAASAKLENHAVWARIAPLSGPGILLILGIPPLALDMGPVEVWWTRK